MMPLDEAKQIEQLVREHYPLARTELFPSAYPSLDIRIDDRFVVIEWEGTSMWVLVEVTEEHAFRSGPIIGEFSSQAELLDALARLIGTPARSPLTAVQG